MDFSFLNYVALLFNKFSQLFDFSSGLVLAHIALASKKARFDPKGKKLKRVGRLHYFFHLAFAAIEPLVLRLVDYLCGKESQVSGRVKLWLLKAAAAITGPLLPNGVVITTPTAERWIDFLDKHEGPKSGRFAIGPCLCQQAMKRWEEPVVKDIFFFYAADIFTNKLKRGFKYIEPDEVKRILRECRDAGLVHELDYCMQSGKFTFCICNCEPRICALTRAYLKTGKLLTAGPEIVEHNPDKCLGKEKCGKCFDACIFDANIEVNGEVTVDLEKCLGCGLCVLSCEENARKMVLRDNYVLDKKIPSEILLGN
jgi:NAD-dependent dihydropyrimidine dehydrogenase PreA subunit